VAKAGRPGHVRYDFWDLRTNPNPWVDAMDLRVEIDDAAKAAKVFTSRGARVCNSPGGSIAKASRPYTWPSHRTCVRTLSAADGPLPGAQYAQLFQRSPFAGDRQSSGP
jgi:hypothetical protein